MADLEVLRFKITDVESEQTKRLERLLSGMNRSQTGFKATLRSYIVSQNMDYRRLLEQHPDCEPPTNQTHPYYYLLVKHAHPYKENCCESLFTNNSG